MVSGYGIANLAATLGVHYLDKLEKVVNYNATCHVLEYIWIATGIAIIIMKYLSQKNKHVNELNIEPEKNPITTVEAVYSESG